MGLPKRGKGTLGIRRRQAFGQVTQEGMCRITGLEGTAMWLDEQGDQDNEMS